VQPDDNFLAHLRSLYRDGSKHAVYQNIPRFVSEEIGYFETINETWRGDTARYAYLKQVLPWAELASVADIGANTGFFTLSLAHEFPGKRFAAYELNANHCGLMRAVQGHFSMANVEVHNEGLTAGTVDTLPQYDLMILLNVLHHMGADFDRQEPVDPENFRGHALAMLRQLRHKTRYLALQVGYNLWGDKAQPIVDPADPEAMCRYMVSLLDEAGWSISHFGMYDAARRSYESLPQEAFDGAPEALGAALQRLGAADSSEFYKRPLLVCKTS
jgi:hypothetical protein